ncbi:MAG: winged helix-turn-helix domain-containing protein [Dokdonella sp.]
MRYRFGTIELRVPERELLDNDHALAIEPMVFDLLAYLVEHRDRAVGRDELIAAVWGRLDVADGALAQAMLRLRKTLAASGMSADPVRTVPRHGYRWVAETQTIASSESVPAQTHIEVDSSADAVLASAPAPAPATARRRRFASLPMSLLGLLALIAIAALIYRLAGDPAPDLADSPLRVSTLPIEPPVEVPATLADARRLSEQGQTKDAHALLVSLHQKEPSRADILVALASTECALELMATCDAHLDEALALTTIDADSKANAHLLRADRHLTNNKPDDAATEIDAAATAIGDSADNQWQARILLARQHLAIDRDQVPQALDFARRSLTLFRLAEDARGQAAAQLVLGDLAADAGNFDECVASYSTAADVYEKAGDLDGLARASARTAMALAHLGRFNDARIAAQRSYAAAMRQQNPVATRIALYSLGWSLLQSGQLNDARETAHRSLAMIDTANNPNQAMRLTSLLGFIDAAGGRFRTAMSAWDAALEMAHGDPFTVNGFRLAIVYAALNAGDEKRAEAEAKQLRQDAGKAGGRAAGFFADHADALLAAHRGDLDAAARLYAEVWKRARLSGTINQQVLADYSDVLFKRGDLDAVESLLGEASLPDKEGHLVQLVRARYLLRRGQIDAAQAAFVEAVRLAAERYSPLIDVTRAELAAARSSH